MRKTCKSVGNERTHVTYLAVHGEVCGRSCINGMMQSTMDLVCEALSEYQEPKDVSVNEHLQHLGGKRFQTSYLI